jgi:hypothetical protein
MDHEVVPMPCKKCDWLLNSSQDHFGSHQGKNVRVTKEFEVLKRRILRLTLSIDMNKPPLPPKRRSYCAHVYNNFEILKYLGTFFESLKRFQKFHPTFKIGSNTKC